MKKLLLLLLLTLPLSAQNNDFTRSTTGTFQIVDIADIRGNNAVTFNVDPGMIDHALSYSNDYPNSSGTITVTGNNGTASFPCGSSTLAVDTIRCKGSFRQMTVATTNVTGGQAIHSRYIGRPLVAVTPIAAGPLNTPIGADNDRLKVSAYPPGQFRMVPISATAAVNNQTTLTIPAPMGAYYNYVCYLEFDATQDGTSSANTNQVTTSTNFNSFAIKYSLEATANKTYSWFSTDWNNYPNGCVRSTAPGTATTFVSPAAIANTAFSWYGVYYQAP